MLLLASLVVKYIKILLRFFERYSRAVILRGERIEVMNEPVDNTHDVHSTAA